MPALLIPGSWQDQDHEIVGAWQQMGSQGRKKLVLNLFGSTSLCFFSLFLPKWYMLTVLKKEKRGEFPGSLVVKTPCFCCRQHEFNPGQGIKIPQTTWCGIPWWLLVENPPVNARDLGLMSRSERSPGERNGNPLQYSCLENPHGQRRPADYSPWGHRSGIGFHDVTMTTI